MLVLSIGTSGPDPKKHSIVDLGAVDTTRFRNGEPSPFFYNACIVWPGAEVDEDFLGKNGFTESEAQITNEIIHETLIYGFNNWLKKSEDITLVVEDTFPITSFLRESFSTHMRNGRAREVPYPFGNKAVDIHSIAYAAHRERGVKIPLEERKSSLTLDKILEFVSTHSKNSGDDEKDARYLRVPEPCDALTRTILITEAFWRLTHGRSLFSDTKNWGEILPSDFPEKRIRNIPNFSNYSLSQYIRDIKKR
jgi:hypothetical protein